VRLQPELLAALDEWVSNRPDPRISRPEAIRSILYDVLAPARGRDNGGDDAKT
jgi:hypothetical protein